MTRPSTWLLLPAALLAIVVELEAPAQDVDLRLEATGTGERLNASAPLGRADVREVTEQIACTCGCRHMEVAACYCGMADKIRAEIAEQLDSGMTAAEVVSAFVAENGEAYLAVPPREGLHWVIWVGPVLLLLCGLVLVLVLGRRWSRRSAPAPAGPSGMALDPEVEERLRIELARALDGEGV